jgi:hypothetical protein
MATIQRNGVILELPDYVSVADDPPRGPRRRGSRGAGAPATPGGLNVCESWFTNGAQMPPRGIEGRGLQAAGLPNRVVAGSKLRFQRSGVRPWPGRSAGRMGIQRGWRMSYTAAPMAA